MAFWYLSFQFPSLCVWCSLSHSIAHRFESSRRNFVGVWIRSRTPQSGKPNQIMWADELRRMIVTICFFFICNVIFAFVQFQMNWRCCLSNVRFKISFNNITVWKSYTVIFGKFQVNSMASWELLILLRSEFILSIFLILNPSHLIFTPNQYTVFCIRWSHIDPINRHRCRWMLVCFRIFYECFSDERKKIRL